MDNQFSNTNIERINYYKQKLLINDNDYESSYNLAEVFWQNLQLEEAIFYFKKSIKINPQFKKSEQQLKKAIKEKKGKKVTVEIDNLNQLKKLTD